MPMTRTCTHGCSVRERTVAYIFSLCGSLVVSYLAFPNPSDLFAICGSDFNVVPFVGVEDSRAEGTGIGRALAVA
jgi:hypothetical protein